jgi:hypothetical protein
VGELVGGDLRALRPRERDAVDLAAGAAVDLGVREQQDAVGERGDLVELGDDLLLAAAHEAADALAAVVAVERGVELAGLDGGRGRIDARVGRRDEGAPDVDQVAVGGEGLDLVEVGDDPRDVGVELLLVGRRVAFGEDDEVQPAVGRALAAEPGTPGPGWGSPSRAVTLSVRPPA